MPRTLRRLVLVVVAPSLFALGWSAAPARAADPKFVVIVHPSNPIRSIRRRELERIYRRELRFWDDRSRIVPVNLPFSTALRAAFSRRILRSSADSLVTYWNRRYFQGVFPPPVLKSGAAIRTYVASTPNAIGYVRRSDADASVKIVEVPDAD